jgi:hypothetical protein
LRPADRIEITYAGHERLSEITDRAIIDGAAGFIASHRDGWIDRWHGPAAPVYVLEFYSKDEHLGGFGIGRSYITYGSISKEVPSSELAALAKALGVLWPPTVEHP